MGDLEGEDRIDRIERQKKIYLRDVVSMSILLVPYWLLQCLSVRREAEAFISMGILFEYPIGCFSCCRREAEASISIRRPLVALG